MKRKGKHLLAFLVALMVLAFAGCAQSGGSSCAVRGGSESDDTDSDSTSAGGMYQKITADQAQMMMDEDEDMVILDVRTQEEYNEKHIPKAIVIPNETIGTEQLEELPDLDQEILVYCRSGNRSRQASEKLIEIGYTNVYDFGGINDWPYEVE